MRVRQRHVITVVMDTATTLVWAAGCGAWVQHFAEHARCRDRGGRDGGRAGAEATKSTDFCGG